MDISIGSDSSRFNVSCSLAHCDISVPLCTVAMNEKGKIPAAFGYRDKPPIIAALKITAPEIIVQETILGSIRDESGRMIFYHDLSDGKIKVRSYP